MTGVQTCALPISTINLIVAQRLVRRICDSCIESYEPTKEMTSLIKEQIKVFGGKNSDIPETLFRGKGCNVCGNTGFSGQIGIFEVFTITDEIKEMIMSGVSESEIRKQALAEGMTPMFKDGLDKIEKGITTIEEVMRVVNE